MRRTQNTWPPGERPNHDRVIAFGAGSVALAVAAGALVIIAALGAVSLAPVVMISVLSVLIWVTSIVQRSHAVNGAFFLTLLAAAIALIGHTTRSPLLVVAMACAVGALECAAISRQLDSVVALPKHEIAGRGVTTLLSAGIGVGIGCAVLAAYGVAEARSSAVAALGALAMLAVVGGVAAAARLAGADPPRVHNSNDAANATMADTKASGTA